MTPPAGPPGALTLIGAGHVFQIRKTIGDAILALRPDIVFLELDRGRLHALLERRRGTPPPQPTGFVERKLVQFQEGVAGIYGAELGEEMLAAFDAARMVGAQVAVIDEPADKLLVRVRQEMPWRERLRFLRLFLGGWLKVRLPGGRKRAKKWLEDELAKLQKDPDAVLADLARQFPTVHRIVVAERDAAMANRIRQLLPGKRHGVAVLGDGHVGGMTVLLGDLKPAVYRLEAVRSGRLPKPSTLVATGTPERVGFSVQVRS